MLKKVLFTICFVFYSSHLFAKCTEGYSFEWKWVDIDRTTSVNVDRAHYAKFILKSTSNKPIKITRIYLTTGDEVIVKQKTYENFVLKPFGKDSGIIYVRDLNLDVVKSGGISCRSISAATQPQKPSTTYTNPYNNPNVLKTDYSGVAIVLILILTIFLIIFLVNIDANADKKPKKKLKFKISKENVSKKDSDFFSNRLGYSFRGKYIVLAVPAVGGLMFFENGFVKFIFGVYLCGCIIGIIFYKDK